MKTKIKSVIEVSMVFLLAVLLFRAVHAAAVAVQINNFLGGYLFAEYAALLLTAVAVYAVRCRVRLTVPFAEKLRYQLKIVAQGFFPLFTLSAFLSWINWQQWPGAILISIIEIGLLFWLAWMIRHNQPPWQKISVGGSLLLFPVVIQTSSKPANVLLAIAYSYLFIAISEETLFRGYIQSRLDAAFGHPRQLFGIGWGPGLVITSLFFGLWHVGWQTDSLSPAWPHVLWTLFAGLLFGIVRTKSESIIAPAILHGIMNYGPQAILFYLFGNQ